MTQSWLDRIADPTCPLELFAGRADMRSEVLGPRQLDCHLLFLLLHGSYEGEVNGRALRVLKGDLLWIPPRVPHRLVATKPLRKYFLRLHGAVTVPAPQPVVRRLGEEVLLWCRSLVAEQDVTDAQRGLRMRALLTLLFSAWDRAGATAVGGLDPVRRARLVQLVGDDPSRRWRRDELGAALGISGLHLGRQVQRTFGRPLRRWLVESRIRAAAHELRDGSSAIGELAERYGYPDVFLFSRQFRLVMGIGPRSWRQGLDASQTVDAAGVHQYSISG